MFFTCLLTFFWSPYNYAYDNPIRFIDPDGMKADDFGNVTYSGFAGLGEGGYIGGTEKSEDSKPCQCSSYDEKGNPVTYGDSSEIDQTGGGPFGDLRPVTSYNGNFTGSNADRSTYFEGVRIHTSEIGDLKNRAAFTLPVVGIFVNPKDATNIKLLSHEFGHILQAQIWGNYFFYRTIVPVSISSANNDPSYDHQGSWTEWTANWFSYNYFGKPSDWTQRIMP